MSVTFAAVTRTFNPALNADVLASIPEAEELEINMSNSNAVLVCESLGINLEEEGWCGSLPAQDFLGRVLVALAVSPADEGMPSHDLQPGDDAGPLFGIVREGGPRIIQGARRPGYLQERLGQLRELADWAVAHDAEIDFG